MKAQAPRLRVDRLVIVESRSPLSYIRKVDLHAGLNIVWGQELPAVEGTTDVERAGHGVGKSTFMLMLRAVLGDDGAAVKTMRNRLAEYYDSGGIAAEVVAGSERFVVFRSFGSQSFAVKDATATVEQVLEKSNRGSTLNFSAYTKSLGDQACLKHMARRALPVTHQTVEWTHVLCWIARDQALGLRQYFEWRNDDGTGLRCRVRDPPALTRLVLGLLADAEAKAEAKIASITIELASARDTLRSEEQRGANTRAIVEAQLRTWAGVSNSLQMLADDLFSESVGREIQRKTLQIEAGNDADRAAAAILEREIFELELEIQDQNHVVELAKSRWEEAAALKNMDDSALAEIRRRRDQLLTLVGTCKYGNISYDNCVYIQDQRDTVQISAKRDVLVLTGAIEEREDREAEHKTSFERESKTLGELHSSLQQKTEHRAELNKAIEKRLRHLGESDSIRKTLSEWQEHKEAPETEKLRTARARVVELEKKLDGAKVAKVVERHQVSDRERQMGARFAKFAEAFGAFGRYEPADERRPFHMLRANGDAYTVLEILLGDLACAVDGVGVEGGGAHPGLLIFDCPREREMSPQLYDRFLELVDEVCKASPGLQVIVTTTTPPPEPLREPPTRILKLSHASDEDLLLRRRIENLLARATPSLQDSPEEEA